MSDRNITIEFSVANFITNMAATPTDPVFKKAMDLAVLRHAKDTRDLVTLFGECFTQLNPKAQLAPIFNTFENIERIHPNSTNVEVLKVISTAVDEAIKYSLNILQARVEGFGLPKAEIVKQPSNDRYIIRLKEVQEPERLMKILQSSAKVGMWETFKLNEIMTNLQDAHNKLADMKSNNVQGKKFDLFTILMLNIDSNNKILNHALVGYAAIKDTATINKMLKLAQDKLPRNLFFGWSCKPVKYNANILELVALRISTRDGKSALTNAVITDAKSVTRNDQVIVEMSFNAEGARILKRMTQENVGNELAIVIDGYVYAYPTVMDAINSGKLSMSAHITEAEGQDLANILKTGQLPMPIKIVKEELATK